MKAKTLIMYIAALAVLLPLTGCGDRYISVPYTRPAQVNMKDYKAIFVADFTGPNGRELTFAVKKMLVDLKRFDILESFNSAKNTAAAVVIEGDMVQDDYEEKVKENRTYKDDKGASHVEFGLVGRWTTSVNLKIIDISTSKVLYALNAEKTKEITKSDKDRKPKVEKSELSNLKEDVHNIVANSAVNLLIPRTEYVRVRVMEDDDLPELEHGLEYARTGDFENAIVFFKKALDKTKDNEKLAKVYYDIGIAYQYSYDFTNAYQNLYKATTLSQEVLYQDALIAMQKMKNDYDEYMKQL